jgi:trigger factor
MLQEIEELSPTKRKLTINVPTEVIKSETDSAYNEIRANAKIPGFRQGKVPHSILVKKFSKNVEAQIIEKVVPEYYMKAVTSLFHLLLLLKSSLLSAIFPLTAFHLKKRL